MKLTRILIALTLFGISFAYVEAAVVVYLRQICEPIRREAFENVRHDELFPLVTTAQLAEAGSPYSRMLLVELGRELATMVMLAAVGLAVARNFRQWLAGFMIAFGVWDIFYYVFLKLLIGWPASLWTWDILFLMPVPWVGPVLAPGLVAVSMILAGVVILWRESVGRPMRFRVLSWTAIFGGGLMVVIAFCCDYRNMLEGGWPNPFNWQFLIAGELLGLAGFAHALWARPGEEGPVAPS